MPELIHAYDQQGTIVETGTKRDILNKQREYAITNGESPFAVPSVLLLLTHPEDGFFSVQRSNRREDPLLWSETASGHIAIDEDPNTALLREGREEINVDIIIAGSLEEYRARLRLDNLIDHAVVRPIDFRPWMGAYRIDRETHARWMKRTRTSVYAGVYRGEVQCSSEGGGEDDSNGLGETLAVQKFKKDDLVARIAAGDPRFRHQLTMAVRDYHAFIEEPLEQPTGK
ncbi:MAG: NUDIX domain-containing protein [Candidatus Woesearchaeota archaeon]|nr:NUDIX domain-containing protein [Candidatus Woesearchaeota archaeon]